MRCLPLVRLIPTLSVLLLLGLFILPGSALAHEHRTIANGKYDVTVGWDVEPAYQGQKNAASIRIARAGSNPAVPVEGAEKTLKVQVRQGGTAREFPLRAVFGQKGYYVADLVPTREGDYRWTFVGSIDGNPVNNTFDTADGKFNGVEPITGLQFPQALPDPAAQNTAIAAGQVEAQNARVAAYVGAGIGGLGLLLAIGAWLSRPRRVAKARLAVSEQA